ncbi:MULTISPECIES: hypothetical protein [Arthrobacter]|uniref:Uncharacterized protein n=2 Tax=Arthrobacter TaxID=1663 RepID=A0ABU9KMJ0_9MICC|nr:hypothetical protein [Arthrobacter sp. YJM1]MDP5228008.1 hypothetical protein [Arthrobacter sp. YJM1]
MFSTRHRIRAGAGLLMAGALAFVGGTGAYAHDCFNASRSAQGNASAGANSQAWFTLVVADAIQGGVGQGYDQAQADCWAAAYAASGAPASFTIHSKGAVGQGGTIGTNNPNEYLLANGKGIDHVFDAYGMQIMGTAASCGIQFGPPPAG